MADRITLREKSMSTTQHYLEICLDGHRIDSVHWSRRDPDFTAANPWKCDLTDQEEAEIKTWFVQRYLCFTTAHLDSTYALRYDQERAGACHTYPAAR